MTEHVCVPALIHVLVTSLQEELAMAVLKFDEIENPVWLWTHFRLNKYLSVDVPILTIQYNYNLCDY